MRKKVCRIFLPIGLAVLFFYCASKQGMDAGEIENAMKNETGLYSEDRRETPGTEILETEILETEASGSETAQAELPEIENTETETEISEIELTEEQMAELSTHYGTYRITEFCDTKYTSINDHITEQEADMMLGRIVEITPERLVTYGPERGLGTREGRDCFNNYMVEIYNIDNPSFEYSIMHEGDWLQEQFMAEAGLGELSEQLDGMITTPQLSEPYGKQKFYTFKDKDILVLYSEVAGEYFLLERCEEEPKEEHTKWSGVETKKLLEKIYGAYQVAKFLPTKFFPITDYNDEEMLSADEADMMLGRIVTISEDLFVTYDNWWRYNRNRPWVAEAEVKNPDYRVKTVWADEIYGIRDGMLPEDLAQQEYVEVDVYPGYWSNMIHMNLPQMYLVNDGRIILYAMGQYFLLERTDSEKVIVYEKDLSVWLGSYAYTDGDSTYHIEILEESPGKYEAEIEANLEYEYIKTSVDVYGSSERISFAIKKEEWNNGKVILRLRRDAETGVVYTYWGEELNRKNMNLDTQDKEAGRICFVKE